MVGVNTDSASAAGNIAEGREVTQRSARELLLQSRNAAARSIKRHRGPDIGELGYYWSLVSSHGRKTKLSKDGYRKVACHASR